MSTSSAVATTPANAPAGAPEISHALLLTGAQVARRLLRLVFALVAARVLGPEPFGVYALLFAVAELLSVASGSGFLDYLTRESAKSERLGWGLGAQLILLRLAYAVPLGTAAVSVLLLLAYPRSVFVAAAWMFLTLVPRAASEAVQGVLRGIGRYGLFLVVELSLGSALVIGAFVLLLRRGGLRVVIATELAAALVAGLVALILAFRLRSVERTQLPWLELVRKTFVFNIYPLVGNLYDRQDAVLLSKLAGNYATGIYSVAYRGLGMLQLIPYSVLYSLLPTLSRSAWEGPEKQRLEKAMGLLLSVALAAVLGTIVFADPIVRLVLGARYAESATAAKILTWALIPMYINFALNIALLATDREKVFLATSSVCLAVNLIANLILIPMFSWRAAAAVTIATELVLLAQNGYWIRRTFGRVPVPYGALRTSLVFACLLGMALAGKWLVSPLLVGAVCLGFFVAYLHGSGTIAEFGKVWRPERGAAA